MIGRNFTLAGDQITEGLCGISEMLINIKFSLVDSGLESRSAWQTRGSAAVSQRRHRAMDYLNVVPLRYERFALPGKRIFPVTIDDNGCWL
jgi:hypothetical protein